MFHRVFKSWVFTLLPLGLLFFMQLSTAAQGLPFSLSPSFAHFKPLRLNSAEKQWLAEHDKLRVGIAIADYEPVDITHDRNRYQGISADYLSIVRDKLGVSIEVLGYKKRDQAVAELLSGKIDILASASSFESGVEGLVSSTAYMTDRSVIVGRGCDTDPAHTWSGKKIGFIDGYIDIHTAHAFYPDSEIIITPTLHSAMEALIEGDIDAFIGNEVIIQSFKSVRPYSGLRIIGDSALPDSGFAFATRRADPMLGALIERALGSLDEAVSHRVLARWTSGLEGSIAHQHLNLLPREREWIKRNPVVTVAGQQFPLYAFKNGNGRWEGLSVDILKRVSRMTGLQFVHKEAFSTEHTLDMLQSGEAQMNATLSINHERKAFLNFTYSYGGSPWVFVVRSHDSRLGSLDQLSGMVLVLPARHALEELIKREYPAIELRQVDTYAQARRMVEQGEADATIQSETQAYLYPPGRLKVGRSVDGRWVSDNFSVHAQYPELLGIMNHALEAMPINEIRTLRAKWLGAVGQAPLIESGSHQPVWLSWVIALLVAAGLMLFFCNRRLKKQVHAGRETEQVLCEQLAFQRRFLDGIPSPIFVCDLQGAVITCNQSYEERMSIKLEHIRGQNSIGMNIFPQKLAEQLHCEVMQMILSRQPYYQKRMIEIKSGPMEIYQWTVPFYSASGRLEGLVGGWFDISEVRKWDPRATW